MCCKSICFCILRYPLGLSASISLLLGGHFGGITSDYLTTITMWANDQATPSSLVCLEPANKKLQLLENLESGNGDGNHFTNSIARTTIVLLIIVAPFTSCKKWPSSAHGRRKDVSYTLLEMTRSHISESKPYCESLFDIERVFCTSREHVLCRWPCQEFATLVNFAPPSQSCLLCAWQLR